MVTPRAIAALRRIGVWDAGRRVHRAAVPPLCQLVHRTVVRTDSRWLPTDLVLKHRFDARLVWIAPHQVAGSVRAGEWASRDPARDQRPLARLRRWWVRGGAGKSVHRHLTRNVHGRFVVGGDWDRPLRPFTPRESVLDLLAGVPPRATAEYQRIAGWIAHRDLRWTRGCRTLDELDRYFDDLARCVTSIRDEGYLTQEQLGADPSDEIKACIDRDGRISVFGGGTHRLTVALALGLERIPVTVRRVHADWAASLHDRYTTSDVIEAVERGIAAIERHGPGGRDDVAATTRVQQDTTIRRGA